MFVLLDVYDVLEHIIQLLLTKNGFRRCSLPLLRPFPRVLIAAADLVKLRHPRADHSVLRKTGNVRKAADPSLDVVFENVAEVRHGAAPASDHYGNSVAAKENFHVALDGVDECLVCRDIQLSVQKRLQIY